MRRWAVLLAMAVGCETPADNASAPPTWVYPPQPAVWLMGAARASIGRSQAPQLTLDDGIRGDGITPLHDVTTLARIVTQPVPGDGPARAVVVHGGRDEARTLQLIDVDGGRVLWQQVGTCDEGLAGVTAKTIVCQHRQGVVGISLEGKQLWRREGTFRALTDQRVAMGEGANVLVVDADRGVELSHYVLPGEWANWILATCGDSGRELFTMDRGSGGRLVRVTADDAGATVTWIQLVGELPRVDACTGADLLVAIRSEGDDDIKLTALSRKHGLPLHTLTGVRGWWPARDGSAQIEVATATGITQWPRDLAGPGQPLEQLPLGALLARRGDQRLVAASERTAVLLDAKGVRAYLPLGWGDRAALGDQHLVASGERGNSGETVHRFAYPPRYPRALRISSPVRGVAAAAELRDLPRATDLDPAGAIALATVKPSVTRVLLASDALYALTTKEDVAVDVARFDLRAKKWTWFRADACASTGRDFALAGDVLVCAAREPRGIVRAIGEAGMLWEWTGAGVDSISAGGDVVIVHDADRIVAIDAGNGKALATFASGDGTTMRATALAINGMTIVAMAERNRVVGRLPRGHWMPAWSVEVHGVVASLQAAGDGVLVTLEDGDAYRLDGRTGQPTALAGIGLHWQVAGDLIAGDTTGGPIPPDEVAPTPAAEPAKKAAKGKTKKAPPADDEPPPRLMTPVAPPAAMLPSVQHVLYDLQGALRARNDYAIASPITPGVLRGAGAPLVIESGELPRQALVVEPVRGDPVRRVDLPDEAVTGTAFSTVIDGKPVVGVLLANPLRVLLF